MFMHSVLLTINIVLSPAATQRRRNDGNTNVNDTVILTSNQH
jgi:hypothetical protein